MDNQSSTNTLFSKGKSNIKCEKCWCKEIFLEIIFYISEVSFNVSFPLYYLMKELDQFDLKIKKVKKLISGTET